MLDSLSTEILLNAEYEDVFIAAHHHSKINYIYNFLTVLNIINKLHSTECKFDVARMRNKSNRNRMQVGFFLGPFSRSVKVWKF